MNIELSVQDVELISKALESHEKEVGTTNIMTEMMMAVFCGKEGPTEKMKADSAKRMDDAKREEEARKSRCLMLRARLAEAFSRKSEFSTSHATKSILASH